MSFDMGPMGNLSNVQKSAKSCAGGGGNTGYFSRNSQEEEENTFTFAKDSPNDSFEKVDLADIEDKEESDIFDTIKKFFKNLISKIKSFFIAKK